MRKIYNDLHLILLSPLMLTAVRVCFYLFFWPYPATFSIPPNLSCAIVFRTNSNVYSPIKIVAKNDRCMQRENYIRTLAKILNS